MRNKVQIIQQFEQTGSHANRYDVTIWLMAYRWYKSN